MAELSPQAVDFLNKIAAAASGTGAGGFGPNAAQQASYGVGAMSVPSPIIQSQTREPDDFFGPIGNLAAGLAGLTSTDAYGRVTPIFRSSLNPTDTSRSLLTQGMIDNNTRVTYSAQRQALGSQNEAWGRMFGENGSVGKLIESKNPEGNYNFSLGTRTGMQFVSDLLSRPELAQVAMPYVNEFLGYDRGVSASMFGAKSGQIMSGMRSRQEGAGGIYGSRDEGGTYHADGSFHLVNPFAADYTEMRQSVAETGEDAVQRMMYDGFLKKDSMHGASETLVGSIVANAMATGALNNEEGLGAETMSDLMNDRVIAVRERADLSRRLEEKKADRSNAVEGSDTAKRLDEEIAQLEREFSNVQSDIDAITEKVVEAASPLVESVTGAVEAMKDFYGSEVEAARMLDTLTGGQGTKDKAVAQRTMRQMEELNVMSNLAGIDPTLVGKHLERQQSLWGISGSKLSGGSGLSGQMALMSENRMMRAMVGLGGDPKAQAQLMDAAESRANAGSQSKGYRALIAAEYARKSGRFRGRESDLDEIIRDLQNGDPTTRKAAYERLAVAGWGSVKEMERQTKDPTQLALMEADVSEDPEAARRIAEAWDQMSVTETDEFMKNAGFKTDERRMYSALQESGLDVQHLNNSITDSEYSAMEDALSGMHGEEGGDAAHALLTNAYQAELKRNGGDESKARRAALATFKSAGGMDLLSDENRSALDSVAHDARMEAMYGAVNFEEGNAALANSKDGEGWGWLGKYVSGSDGTISRAALSKAGSTVFDALRQNRGKGVFLDENGNELSEEQIKALEDKFKTGLKGKNGVAATENLLDVMRMLNPNGQELLRSRLDKQGFFTTDQADDMRDWANEDDMIRQLGVSAEAAKEMRGMSHDDAVVWAKNWKKLQSKDISEEERAELQRQNDEIKERSRASAKGGAESLVEAFQTGEIEKFKEAIVATGHTVEEANGIIKKFAEALGAVVLGDGDKSLSTLSLATESDNGRAFWLGNNQLGMGARASLTDEGAADYLALLGGGDIRESDKQRYNVKRKAVGDAGRSDKERKSAYLGMLDIEMDAVDHSILELDRKKRGATGDEKDALESQLAGLRRQKDALKDQRRGVESMKPEEFVRTLGNAMQHVDSERKGDSGTGSSGRDDSELVGRVDALCGKIDQLCSNIDRNFLH